MGPTEDITRLLGAVHDGDAAAQEALFRRVHDELRQLAARHMQDERGAHTLQPTAVLNEAWLRLFGGGGVAPRFEDRLHFLRTASTAMRRVLIDHARRRVAQKRGGGGARSPDGGWTGIADDRGPDPLELLAVHEALERLESIEPEQADVVQLRYFGGLEIAEIAAITGVSERTVKRRWAFARAWLFREIGGDSAGDADPTS